MLDSVISFLTGGMVSAFVMLLVIEFIEHPDSKEAKEEFPLRQIAQTLVELTKANREESRPASG